MNKRGITGTSPEIRNAFKGMQLLPFDLGISPNVLKQINEAAQRLAKAMAPLGEHLSALAKSLPTQEEWDEKDRMSLVLLV